MRQGELRVDTTTVEKLEADDFLTPEERRAARFVLVRNVIVGIAVAAATIAFAVYCAMLNSAPWKQ